MISSSEFDSVVALLDNEGKLYFVESDIKQIQCEPLQAIWSTNAMGYFIGLTFTRSYVLVSENKITFIDDLIGDFTVQNNTAWSWEKGIFKGLYYSDKGWKRIECACEKPIEVHQLEDQYLIVTETKWVAYNNGAGLTDTIREFDRPKGKITSYTNNRKKHYITLDTGEAIIIKRTKLSWTLRSKALCWTSNLYCCKTDGSIIYSNGDLICDAQMETSIVKVLFFNIFLAHKNVLTLEGKGSITFHTNIYRLFTRRMSFIVILDDFTVHFGTAHAEMFCLRDDITFDKPLMTAKIHRKSARKL